MIDKKDQPHHNHGNGFTLGMLVGGAVVLLVTTEKGRKLLKDLSVMGMNAMSGVKEDMEIMEEMEEAENDIHTTEPMQEATEDKKPQKLLADTSVSESGASHGKIRKFFKRTKKK